MTVSVLYRRYLKGIDRCVNIAAKSGKNIDELIKTVSELAPGTKQKIRILIPYSDAGLLNELHTNQKVISEEYVPEGIKTELLADEAAFKKLQKYIERG